MVNEDRMPKVKCKICRIKQVNKTCFGTSNMKHYLKVILQKKIKKTAYAAK